MLDKLRRLHLQRGDQAEQQALDFLLEQGLQLVDRNYRCKNGELDLIMRHDHTLVVVEVRFRANAQYGGAVESITSRKQSRIIATTQHYLMNHKINSAVRFDVVAITGDRRIEWIQNAFQS